MSVHPQIEPPVEEDRQIPGQVQQEPEQADQDNRAVQVGEPEGAQVPAAHVAQVQVQQQQNAQHEVPEPPDGLQNYDSWGVWGTGHAAEVERFRTQRRAIIEALKNETRAYPNAEEIVKRSMFDLRDALQRGELTAVDVVSSFVKRAIEIDEKLNCITQMMNNPIEEARKLDEKREKGPLFGLPFSIKSNFHVQGYPATIGLAKQLRENNYPTKTCALVQFLIDQGAVPICLTNVPQGLLAYVTSNPLHGTTRNPWDLSRTPGGSSGGEAALLAAGGIAFGIGNDLVGSLRIPAAFCGLVTLKPTQNRLDEFEMHPGLYGRGRLGLSSGFFTKTVLEQEFLLRLIVGSEEYTKLNPVSSRTKFSSISYLEKIGNKPDNNSSQPGPSNASSQDVKRAPLKIAYFTENGYIPVVPSNERAVEETVKRLEKNYGEQVELVKFDWGDFYNGQEKSDFKQNAYDTAQMLFKNVMPDNGKYMRSLYFREKMDKYLWIFIILIYVKIVPFKRFAEIITSFYSKCFACVAGAVSGSPASVRENQEKTDRFKEKWINYWNEKQFDALICPSFITPAQPFDGPPILAPGTYVTGLFNMLDVPAGIVPVSNVNSYDVGKLNNFSTTQRFFGIRPDRVLVKQRDISLDTEGLPNAVQVVTLPNREEECLCVMKMIEDVYPDAKKLVWNNGVALENSLNGKEKSQILFARENKF